MKKIFSILSIVIFFILIVYSGIGFYIAYSVLRINPTCGLHEGSLPNTWSTKNDHFEYTILAKNELRKNFPSKKYHLDVPIEIRLPVHMNYKIVDTDPGEKGNTAQGGSKPAKIETGIVLQVPLFVQIGDIIRVDTREKKYIERVKK